LNVSELLFYFFGLESHLSLGAQGGRFVYSPHHFNLEFSVVRGIPQRLDELDFGDFAKSMAIPSVGFQSALHKLFKPYFFDWLPEVSHRVSVSLRNEPFPLNIEPVRGTFIG